MEYKYAYTADTLDRIQVIIDEMAASLVAEIPDDLCPDDDILFAHVSDDLMLTLKRACMQTWESWLDQLKAEKTS